MCSKVGVGEIVERAGLGSRSAVGRMPVVTGDAYVFNTSVEGRGKTLAATTSLVAGLGWMTDLGGPSGTAAVVQNSFDSVV